MDFLRIIILRYNIIFKRRRQLIELMHSFNTNYFLFTKCTKKDNYFNISQGEQVSLPYVFP